LEKVNRAMEHGAYGNSVLRWFIGFNPQKQHYL